MRIKGDVDEIRFRNEENGFTIAVMDVDGDPVIATGVFRPSSRGRLSNSTARGSFIKNTADSSKSKGACFPCRAGDGIVRYLGSGLIKGIGRCLRSGSFRISASVRSKSSKKRRSVLRSQGITSAKAGEIAAAYGAIKEMQDAVMTLQSYDIPLGTAMKIYRTYGKDTAETVSANPYRLIEDVDGVGFITADRIAAKAE
ncbi:MAG: helix-hairpin-helix domain-containing protein [Christensenellales bacterium]